MRMCQLRLLSQGSYASIALGGIALCGYLAMNILQSPQARDYRTAVMQVLDQQGVRYRDIIVTAGCAPTYQQCLSYAGSVQVLAEVEHTGQVSCRERWTSCTLSIPELRIRAVPLSDTRNPLIWRWSQLYETATCCFQADGAHGDHRPENSLQWQSHAG